MPLNGDRSNRQHPIACMAGTTQTMGGGGVMRILLSFCQALFLAACAGTAPQPSANAPNAGLWKIDQRFDRITGQPAPTAMVGKPVVDPKTLVFHQALLQLMCFEGAPIVRFAFDFNIGSAKSTTLSYRFDDKPGHPNVKAKFIGRDAKVIIIEERAAVAQFVEELATSNVLSVRIASLTRGRTNVDFPVAGAPAAIEASYAACPIGKDKPRAPRTAAAR